MSAQKTVLGRAAKAAAAFALAVLPMAGCSDRATPARRAAEESVLLVGNAADPASLDPSLTTGLGEFKILSGLFEGLVCADTSDLSIKPAAAKSWSVSRDGKTYVFTLDENAKWSDGTRVKASDFAFAWLRALDPKIGAEYASLLFPLKNARKYNSGKIENPEEVGVRAVSDDVLVVVLEEPTPYFLSLLYHNVYFPLPEHVLGKFNARRSRDAEWTRPRNMVSNGPFTLSKWSINDRVTLKKNKYYRLADKVLLEKVEFLPISNINTEDRAFRTKQIHITESVAPSRIEEIRRDAPETMRCDKWLGVYYYLLNIRNAPLNDARVRRALAMSIDRRAIIDSFLKAGQQPAFSFVPEGCDGYKFGGNKISENVAEARKLLAEAGFPGGKNFPKIKITYNTSEQHKPIAEAVQQMWKKNLGINAELYNLSWPAYLAARRSGDFDAARASWVADFAAPESFLSVFLSNTGLNHGGFAKKSFDEKLSASTAAKTREERLKLLSDAEAEIIDSTAIIPIYFYSRVYRISPMVKGWNANLLDYHNFIGVYLDPSADREILK